MFAKVFSFELFEIIYYFFSAMKAKSLEFETISDERQPCERVKVIVIQQMFLRTSLNSIEIREFFHYSCSFLVVKFLLKEQNICAFCEKSKDFLVSSEKHLPI